MLGGLAVAIIFVVEAVGLVAKIFHSDIGTATGSTTYVSQLNAAIVLPTVALIVGSVVCIILLARWLLGHLQPSARRWRLALLQLVLPATFMLFDVANGTSRFLHREHSVGRNLVFSSLFNLYLETSRPSGKDPRDLFEGHIPIAESAIEKEARYAAAASRPDILFVLMESMGLPKDPDARRFLTQDFAAFAARSGQTLVFDSIPFSGITTSAEFRDLCGLKLDHTLAPLRPFDRCLPSKLQQLGYETASVHGFYGTFFNRYDWYPFLGISKSFFFRELAEEGNHKMCGSTIRGICDSQTIAVAGDILMDSTRTRPIFLYVLTLNSHLPVMESSREDVTYQCNPPAEAEICTLLQIWRGDLARLAAIIDRHRASGRPLLTVIAGDHAPPFLSPSLRSQFSSKFVPVLRLTQR